MFKNFLEAVEDHFFAAILLAVISLIIAGMISTEIRNTREYNLKQKQPCKTEIKSNIGEK